MLLPDYWLGQQKRAHITAVLAALHWLPVNDGIQYKGALFVFKALNSLAPAYVSSRSLSPLLNHVRPFPGQSVSQEGVVPLLSLHEDFGMTSRVTSTPGRVVAVVTTNGNLNKELWLSSNLSCRQTFSVKLLEAGDLWDYGWGGPIWLDR